MTRLLGLDVGTSSVKGIAIDGDGAVLAVAERGYPLSTPRPGWSEQDPEDWWRGAAEVLDELDASGAAGIGLSGQMHGLVSLDAPRRPLRPAILWNDGRTQAQCDEIEERIGFERLVALTGNRALAGFTAPKLLWLAEHEPEVYGQIAHILLPKDYVRLKLTDEHAIDVADASGTLLFDVAARDWSDEVVSALEVDPAWLPKAYESQARTGVTHGGVPVAAGAGDQAAGALGVGVVAEGGPASVVLGTSGVVFAALDRYAHDPQARVHAFCHAVPEAWHIMGVMLSAAGSLQWLRETVGGTYDELLGGAAGVGARGGGPALRALPGRRAHAARRPGRARRLRGARACATTAAPWRAPCSRASPSACATRSTSSRSSAGARAPGASRAAARARSCGWRSSPRCSRCRSRRPSSTRAPPTARRCSAASPPACGAARARPSRRA